MRAALLPIPALVLALALAGCRGDPPPAAPLPPVPVWADELRATRGVPAEAAPRVQKPRIDPEVRQQATARVQEALKKLAARQLD